MNSDALLPLSLSCSLGPQNGVTWQDRSSLLSETFLGTPL